ncbi:hypothetical protein H9P43_003739 [Blastocladiella emersonii ATCC 22665]|nr:hypothetical protein H9P43_003739 [Blastocladiella emersonii ATCC 22665]
MFSRLRPAIARVRQLSTQVDGGAKGGLNKSLVGAGVVAAAAAGYYLMSPNASAPAAPLPAALDPSEFRAFKLAAIEPISHNTAVFRFALPHAEQTIGLPTTSFVLTKFTPEGADAPVVRPYTPTSTDDTKGHFDLLVKRYDGGAMSSHIHSLKVGDSLDVKGPIVKYQFTTANQHKEVGMIAGGTGITPMLQIINKLIRDKEDKTKLTLLFANVSEADILLKKELDAIAAAHPDRFRVHYVIDKATTPNWTGETGHINKDLIKKYIPSAQTLGTQLFVCGPPGMVKAISGSKAPDYSQGELDGILKELGYTKEQVFKV